MVLGAPWQFWAVILPGPLLLLTLRLVTWLVRACGWRRNPRPGYIDLTTGAPKRARKEPS